MRKKVRTADFCRESSSLWKGVVGILSPTWSVYREEARPFVPTEEAKPYYKLPELEGKEHVEKRRWQKTCCKPRKGIQKTWRLCCQAKEEGSSNIVTIAMINTIMAQYCIFLASNIWNNQNWCLFLAKTWLFYYLCHGYQVDVIAVIVGCHFLLFWFHLLSYFCDLTFSVERKIVRNSIRRTQQPNNITTIDFWTGS